MDSNLIYRAVAAGEIDVTAGDATSGLIEALHSSSSTTTGTTFRSTTPRRWRARRCCCSIREVGEALRAPRGPHLRRRDAADELRR